MSNQNNFQLLFSKINNLFEEVFLDRSGFFFCTKFSVASAHLHLSYNVKRFEPVYIVALKKVEATENLVQKQTDRSKKRSLKMSITDRNTGSSIFS